MTKAQHDSETLAKGQQVFTACAFIWHDFDGVKKVFLAKRADTKKFLPGVYELPGGHIDYGEDIKHGLVREVMEEFNMHIELGDVIDVFTYMNEIKKSHSIEVVYMAQFVDPIDRIQTNPEYHSEYGWFTVKELEAVKRDQNRADDPEYAIVKRGFALLKALT